MNIKRFKKGFGNLSIYCMIVYGLWLIPNTCFALEQHPPLSHYQVIEDRNIFRPNIDLDAQPDIQMPLILTGALEDSSEIGDILLTGIIKLRGVHKAILQRKSDEKGFYVVEDDVIDNFTIKDIQSNKVILEKGAETFELRLKRSAPKRKSAVPNKADQNTLEKTIEPQTKLDYEENKYKSNIMKSIRLGIPNVQNR